MTLKILPEMRLCCTEFMVVFADFDKAQVTQVGPPFVHFQPKSVGRRPSPEGSLLVIAESSPGSVRFPISGPGWTWPT